MKQELEAAYSFKLRKLLKHSHTMRGLLPTLGFRKTGGY